MVTAIEVIAVGLLLAATVSCVSSSDASESGSVGPTQLEGAWTVEFVEGRPVIDASAAHFVFWEGGSIGGNASCGSLRGSWSLDGESLEVKASRAGRTQCVPALLEQEERLVPALRRAERAALENGLLVLTTSDGDEVIRASRRGSNHDTAKVRGVIELAEPSEVPAGHTLRVSLADVSLMDVMSTILAETTGDVSGAGPFPYELPYDPARAVGGPSFSVSARITDPEGRLAWISTSSNAALVDGPKVDETVDVRVERVKR
ncbi:MAG: YbaY family lipoprotein [Planctomycetota bacterium]